MASNKYINIDFKKITVYALVLENNVNDIKYVGVTTRNASYVGLNLKLSKYE